MKKTKLIWGIVMICIGIAGFFGIGAVNTNKALYAVVCSLIIAGGALLIHLYRTEDTAHEKAAGQELKRRIAEQRLEESKRELEQAKVDAELKKARSRVKSVKVCPACGAMVNDDVCDYCGKEL